ncbi:MAG TPA: fibronectin type III domain-containing protein [Terriglobia bacterium]|jgi:hypothetical protein
MKTIPIPIKAKVGYTGKKGEQILARLNAVLGGTYADLLDYPNPPVDQATFKSNTEIFTADLAAALDGGAKAIAARDAQETVVVKMLHDVGHYVEGACKGDMTTFLKSGFEPVSQGRTPLQPLTLFIRSIKPGINAGQFLVVLMALLGASYYELRWAPMSAGIPGQWTTIPVTKVRPPISVTGLTPGLTYAFRSVV